MRRLLRMAVVAGALVVGLALPASAKAYYAVAEASVSVRTGPGVGYHRVGVLPAGARVWVSSCVPRWCRISWRNLSGWVAASYLGGRYYEQPYYNDYDNGYPGYWYYPWYWDDGHHHHKPPKHHPKPPKPPKGPPPKWPRDHSDNGWKKPGPGGQPLTSGGPRRHDDMPSMRTTDGPSGGGPRDGGPRDGGPRDGGGPSHGGRDDDWRK